jgi:hypothetical protein
MKNITANIKEIKDFPHKHPYFLHKIIQKLNEIICGKRKIMYSDIINLVIREGMKDDLSKQLILWCNYKIRFGEIFVEF